MSRNSTRELVKECWRNGGCSPPLQSSEPIQMLSRIAVRDTVDVRIALLTRTRSQFRSHPDRRRKRRGGRERTRRDRAGALQPVRPRAHYFDEVPVTVLGELVMKYLKALDEVAYVRFASVYRAFKDVSDFVEEVQPMLAKTRQRNGKRQK
jgi:hypothetical protein